MDLKRKILFLLPSLRGGGAERTLINLLKKINYNCYEIDLIVVSKFGPYVDDVPENVDVKYLYRNNSYVRLLAYLHRTYNIDWFFKRKMSGIKKEYDLGISFLDSNFTDLLFYTDNIKKRIAFVHGSYLTHSNYEKFLKFEHYKKKLKEMRYPRLDGIYFVSHDSMSDFIELFGEFPNMDVVYNIVDKNAVIEKAEEFTDANESKKFTFSAVGSLIPIKGFDRLIRAAGIVKDRGYEFIIQLVGSGPEESRLKGMIRDLGLKDMIFLHGFLSNPYPLMKNSDVFMMSSVSEALPTVLCEAMILGLPVLVTNCSGCRGLVDNGEYGLMAEQDDDDLADKMIAYMENPDLLKKFQLKSLERAELFDDDRILQAYYDIFDGKKPVTF